MTLNLSETLASGGSRGGRPRRAAPPPSGKNFLNFMQFSGGEIKFYPDAPRSEGWRPPPCENPGSATAGCACLAEIWISRETFTSHLLLGHFPLVTEAQFSEENYCLSGDLRKPAKLTK